MKHNIRLSICDVFHNLGPLVSLKNMKNTRGGVPILVILQGVTLQLQLKKHSSTYFFAF